jgi:hypothetical protein
MQIVRGKKFNIFSKDIKKRMKCTLNKRVQLYDGSYKSLPYGYASGSFDIPYQIPEDVNFCDILY